MKKRHTIAGAAAGVLLAVAVPMSASAGSSLYSPTTLASWNQVHSSSLIPFTNHADALVAGTIATIHQQVLNSANQFVVGNSGAGSTTIGVDYAMLTSGRAGCWWNYPTKLSGQLYLTCSIYEIINTSPVAGASKAASTTAAVPESKSQVTASSSQGSSIPSHDQSVLAAEGIDLASAAYLGVVDDSNVWSFTTTTNGQCLVAILPNEIMGSACGSRATFDSNGVSMQFGTSKTIAPTKMYLLPSGDESTKAVSAANATLGATIRATAPAGVLVTVPGGDNSSHTFATSTGKKIHLHEFSDWVEAYAGH